MGEAFESLMHADGRLWRTLPALFFSPGKLGRDYLEGRIARHVPPLRLFLVSLLLLILAAEHAVDEARHAIGEAPRADTLTPGARARTSAQVRATAERAYQMATAQAFDSRTRSLADPNASAEAQASYDEAMSRARARRADQLDLADRWAQGRVTPGRVVMFGTPADRRILADRMRAEPGARGFAAAVETPQYFLNILFNWAHRLAVLLLPIVAGLLTLAYAHSRRFFVYDHLIVSMNFLSFLFLATAAGLAAPQAVRVYWFILLAIWAPANLFMTLRGAYGSSIVGAAVKAAAVTVATALSIVALLIGLLLIAFLQL